MFPVFLLSLKTYFCHASLTPKLDSSLEGQKYYAALFELAPCLEVGLLHGQLSSSLQIVGLSKICLGFLKFSVRCPAHGACPVGLTVQLFNTVIIQLSDSTVTH